jgi:hypothetical protein
VEYQNTFATYRLLQVQLDNELKRRSSLQEELNELKRNYSRLIEHKERCQEAVIILVARSIVHCIFSSSLGVLRSDSYNDSLSLSVCLSVFF